METTGSIDGTDTVPHDHGISRAQNAVYIPPSKTNSITENPLKTLFVGRLDPERAINRSTDFRNLEERFQKIRRNQEREALTGDSRGYAFIEFTHERSCQDAYVNSYKMTIDDRQVLTDYERGRVMEGWVPRRLGGGFGGRKESGQLRFGARDRPFKRPLHVTGNQVMPEILPEQRLDDCWRRNMLAEDERLTQRSGVANNRSVFQLSKDSHFNQQDRWNGSRFNNGNDVNKGLGEDRPVRYQHSNQSYHRDQSIEAFPSRLQVRENGTHGHTERHHRYRHERKYGHSGSRSRSPSRYKRDNYKYMRGDNRSNSRRTRSRSPHSRTKYPDQSHSRYAGHDRHSERDKNRERSKSNREYYSRK
ncbi:5253_t:CDS:2 [Acaulospora morrowiae]|uniref:5253_t:CDS:1 n=1 Tax=Acaulospora morrowiae TaxID=94023 RepID=A0A9N9A3Q0_9GLOM|nr:5253_t:CDS:2 [Acaulospora morrowiae]